MIVSKVLKITLDWILSDYICILITVFFYINVIEILIVRNSACRRLVGINYS